MNKQKKVLLIIAGVIIVTIGVATALFFINQNTTQTPENDLANVPDFGACELITTKIIKESNHGEKITSIAEGTRMGQSAPNNTQADACHFTFNTEQSNSNSLTVKVYPYTASTSEADTKEAIDPTKWSEVASSNPTAYYQHVVEGEKTRAVLRVVPGGKNILFTLQQPTDHEAFDRPNALDFLVGIAVKANLSAIEANEAANTDNSGTDTPPPPPSNTVIDKL